MNFDKKKIFSICIFLFCVILFIFIFNKITYKEYEKNYFYLDTYINVKLYSNKSEKKINKIFNEIENIYSEYHMLTDKYNSYDDVVNVYYLNEVLDNDVDIEINSKLSELIDLGMKFYDITDGYINIASSNLIDIWKEYIEKGEGIPSDVELNSVNIDIDDISLKDDIYSKSNNVKIDLGAYAKGYITELVCEYLESKGIDKYLVDAGGNIKVGNSYNKDNYTIGIQDPVDTSKIFTKLDINNLSVVSSGDYQRYYEYDGIRYNHIIDPYTRMPSSNYKSVTVIAKDSFLADIYSTFLFLVDLEKGKEIVSKNNNIEAVWYIDSDNIVYSDYINK